MAAKTSKQSAKLSSSARQGPSVAARAGKASKAGKAGKASKASKAVKTSRTARNTDRAAAPAKKLPANKARRTAEARETGKKSSVSYMQTAGWDVIDVADGIAVHDEKFTTVHYLNHTAAVAFLLCRQPIDFDVLCAVFREEFKLAKSPAAEIRKILADMEEIQLVHKVPQEHVKTKSAPKSRKK